MLWWSLRAFAAAKSVADVVVALPAGHEHALAAVDPDAIAVPGGESRSESVLAAIQRVESETVVVHDAARPLVTPELIDAVLADLERERCDGVVAAAAVSDTIKQAGADRRVERTLDRGSLWAVQTPQAFRTEALRGALDSAGDLTRATDDAMLVEEAGGTVLVHEAPAENVKVTTPLDLEVAESLLEAR
jgi:2-C-methyl-D-erythritol 4-phosphate cytidylyltransferase